MTGPTGSGKSTTLYAAINETNDPKTNLITVEDPVEYRLAGPVTGAGEREGGTDVRRRAALDTAAGPRQGHDR